MKLLKIIISFDELNTERGLISDLLVQHDIGSAQQVNSAKYLISAHQTQLRKNVPNKNNIIAIFDNLDLREYYVEIDGPRFLEIVFL